MLSQARRQAMLPLGVVHSWLNEVCLAKNGLHFIVSNDRFISEMTYKHTFKGYSIRATHELKTMVRKFAMFASRRVLTRRLRPALRRIRVRRQQLVYLLLRQLW